MNIDRAVGDAEFSADGLAAIAGYYSCQNFPLALRQLGHGCMVYRESCPS